MACAVVSAVTLYHYQWAIKRVLENNLYDYSLDSYFTDNEKKPELTDQETTMVAISSLVVLFSLIEIALAVGGARCSDLTYQPPQENQVSHV